MSSEQKMSSISSNGASAAAAAASATISSSSASVTPFDTSSNHRIVLLTGATGAIGQAIALGTARAANTALVLAVRNADAGSKLVSHIVRQSGNANVVCELVDLASKQSIIDFARNFNKKYGKLNVLINNAATVPQKHEKTSDGLEMQFAVNVYAYYLLMTELRPALKAASPSRVVNVASNYAGGLNLSDLHFSNRRYDITTAYKQSKQADRMLTYAAAARFASDGITVNACHPGVVTSALLKAGGMQAGYDSPEDGAATPLFLALDSSKRVADVSGCYFEYSKQRECPFARDAKAIGELWDYCAKL